MIKNNSGAILILAIFILLLIGLLVTAGYIIITNQLEIVTYKINDLKAMYCADAGIEYAIYALRATATYDGTFTKPCITGSTNYASVTVTEDAPAPNDYLKTITSVGTIYFTGGGTKFQRKLQAKVLVNRTNLGLYYVTVRDWREK